MNSLLETDRDQFLDEPAASIIIMIEKTDIETKLPKPYNNCTDSYPETEERNYRQGNCFEICINREVKIKCNCSFPSYYEIKGLERCPLLSKMDFLNEFSFKCEKECPRQV